MNTIGLILAFLALIIGSFFFLYSVRYYLIVAMVLTFSRKAATRQRDLEEKERKKERPVHRVRGILYSLFRERLSQRNGKNGINGSNGSNGSNGGRNSYLNSNGLNGPQNGPRLNNNNNNNHNWEEELENWQPFISIHIPFYNEKKVANRILAALTALDYENFEVVVVDDSTDETVEILKKWKLHPKVKIFHRDSREGFKGGALKVALEKSDPRTEFVVVFDADFVPYPDTLKQFVRYFYLTTGKNYKETKWAAVQGYQWHVLNKNENWITRGVRTEFAGSYVIERPATEIAGLIRLIAGSVYMVRVDLLKKYGWMTSITEDFQLTLRLYADGYRVIYTPYIQAPSECVSTIKRLVRQRMRWAEGHTHNIKKMFAKILRSPHLRKREKMEFLYLSPYYLQAALFITGTTCWFLSDAVFHTSLPFWTALWGWCLVLTNLFSLPLLNGVGIFLEEGEQRDYLGIFSFVLLSYILAPFQAYAAIKGLLEKEEGHWFRTPKSGRITDAFFRSRFRRWFGALFPGRAREAEAPVSYLQLTSSYRTFDQFEIKPQPLPWLARAVIAFFLIIAINLVIFARNVPEVLAVNPTVFYLHDVASNRITSVLAWQLQSAADITDSTNTQFGSASLNGTVQFRPGATYSSTGTPGTPTNYGWIYDTAFGAGGSIQNGQWTFYWDKLDNNIDWTCYFRVLVFKVQISGGAIAGGWTNILDTTDTTNFCTGGDSNGNFSFTTGASTSFTSGDYLYVEYWANYTKYKATSAQVNFHTGPNHNNPRIVPPTVQIPEKVILLLAIIPFLPLLIRKLQERAN